MAMLRTKRPKASAPWLWKLWWQWTLVSALSQVMGLSIALLLERFVSAQEDFHSTIARGSFNILVGALCGGALLAITQWFVLRNPLPALRWQTWMGMTVLGVYGAWVSGMVVLALVFNSIPVTATDQFRTPQWYALLAIVGVVASGILGLAQWCALQKYLFRARYWILANALAWAPALVLLFVGSSFVQASAMTWSGMSLFLAFILSANTLLGATTGFTLICLMRQRRLHALPQSSRAHGERTEEESFQGAQETTHQRKRGEALRLQERRDGKTEGSMRRAFSLVGSGGREKTDC